MVSSSGFGGGPALPMGDSNMMVTIIVLVLIIGAVLYLITNVFQS